MIEDPHDEFYIGYDGPAPPRSARAVTAFVSVACAMALVVGAVVLAAQRPFAAARFEWGEPRPHSGRVVADPYPSLVDPGSGQRTWLVGQGKFGADDLVAGAHHRLVDLSGTLIERGAVQMLEVVPSSVTPASSHRPPAPASPRRSVPSGTESLGQVTLRGEVVDSKCFLGVMNPGERAVHRDCAVRCLSGGIPPMLLVRHHSRREQLIALVSSDRAPIGRRLLDVAGRAVEVTGELETRHGTLFLLADRDAYRPLSGN